MSIFAAVAMYVGDLLLLTGIRRSQLEGNGEGLVVTNSLLKKKN